MASNNPNTRYSLRKSGKIGNKGGGRKKDKFIEWCRKLCEDPKAQKFVRDLVTGEPVEEKEIIGGTVRTIRASANASARMKALEFVSGYAYGKPAQSLEVSGDFTVDKVEESMITSLIEKRVKELTDSKSKR